MPLKVGSTPASSIASLPRRSCEVYRVSVSVLALCTHPSRPAIGDCQIFCV